MFAALVVVLGLNLVLGQGPGRGIAKNTYACSKAAAEKTFYWFTKYLPVQEANDDCQDRSCTCGEQSRVTLNTMGQPGTGFGIHCTYAGGEDDSRAAANGGVTETEVAEAYAEAINDWKGYSTSKNAQGYAGFALGLWSSVSLDFYIQAFAADGVAYLAGEWSYAGATYYSVKVLVPDTPIIFDILGTACTACSGDLIQNITFANETAPKGFLTPWYVSRAVDDLDIVRTYYKNVFGISPNSYTNDDGNAVLDFTLSTRATVIIRYVQVQGQTGPQTTSWLQSLLTSTDITYQTDPEACWPLWGDFHYAYDDNSFRILPAVTAAGALGFPYRSFASAAEAGPSNAYVVEPSGMWIQLDGDSTGLPPSGGFVGDYCYTFCQANNMTNFTRAEPSFSLRGASF